MKLQCEYHDKLEFKYLKPSQKLIKMAYKQLLSDYKKSINGERYSYQSRRTFYFNYFKIRNGKEVIRYEFVYWVKSGKNERIYNEEGNQFVFMGAHNFAKQHGIENEKRCFSYIGGYTFKPTYHDFVYSYTMDRKEYSAFRFSGSREYDESYTKIKINDYLTINGKHTQDYILQRYLNSDPTIFEMLYKFGFMNLLGYKISKPKLNFIKSNIKFLPKDIQKSELDMAYTLYFNKKNWKDYKKVKYTMTYYGNKIELSHYDIEGRRANWGNTKRVFSSTNIKAFFRIQNLLKEKTETMETIKDFLGICWWYNLDFNKEIFKGKKERDGIIKTYFQEKEEKERIAKENERRERERKEKERLEDMKLEEKIKNMTLPEVTDKYKEIKIDNFTMKPLRTMKDFSDIQENMSLCLIRNEYYKKVLKEKSILYIVVPENKKDIEGLVVEWKVEAGKELKVSQISGYNNGTTDDYDTIKEIAKKLTYEDLITRGA